MVKRQVSLKTIAEKCDVSMMTVSRALDPRHKDRMRASTRKRILETVEECGYTSNIAARRLKSQRSETITLVMRDRLSIKMDCLDFDSHYEYISFSIMKGALKGAREYNYDIKFELAPFDESFQIKPTQTDGILFSTLLDMEHVIRDAEKWKMPYLAVGSSVRKQNLRPENSIVIDRAPGVLASFEHLREKGHEKIGFIGASTQLSSESNCKLLRNFLMDGAIYDDNLFYDVFDCFSLRKLLASFNREFPFTALVCFNDTLADSTVRELRNLGVEVPRDLAVVGFDGNTAYRGEGKTNPSTVYVPWEETLTEAVRTLIQKIENKNNDTGFTKTLPTKFIMGETT